MNWNDLRMRIRSVFLRGRDERELEEELGFHLEMQAQKNRQAGISETESRRQALVQFGSPTAVKEQCRDERRIGLIETLHQDLRYAIRGFRRSPAFAITVIVTIGVGLGINTAAFTIFNAYVLRPIAVSDPYSLYQINWLNRAGQRHLFSWPQYQQLRTDNPAISDLHAVRGFQLRVNGRQCFAELVTGNYFSMLGVGATLGRTLRPSDSSAPGQGAVMVLSYRAWQNLFAADPDIVGQKVLVHGYPLEVVGVAREGFGGLGELARDFWVPLTMYPLLVEGPNPFDQSSPERLYVIARLKPGLTEARARALMNTMAPRLTPGLPEAEGAVSFALESRATAVHVSFEALLFLIPLVVVFGLVLLMACANVANMMLARAMARQREIGIRLSLGAARSRLIRQLLTESVLLALPGAAAGSVISQLAVGTGTHFMMAALPAEFAEFVRIAPLNTDARVFTFMIAAAVICGIIFGIAPALQATRGGIVQAARGDFGHQFRPQRLRNALVLVQITGCSFLLICAGMLLRSTNRVANLDTGMRTRDVISVEIQEKARDRVLARLAAEPLVGGLSASTTLPFDSGFPSTRLTSDNEHLTDCLYDSVSPEFFNVLGIPLERGRNFTDDEALTAAPVAIVSHTLAQRLWPYSDAIGQPLRLVPDARSHVSRRTDLRFEQARVIGVARDVNTAFVDDQNSRMLVYFPTNPRAAGTVLLLRVHEDAERARQNIDRALGESVPGAVDGIHKMQSLSGGRVFPLRMAYWVAAVLGTLAIMLAIAGIYGVLSYLVVQRSREIGVRMALGATAASIIGLVVRQGLRLACLGIGLGLVLGMGAWKMLASALMAVRSFDAIPFAAGGLIVLFACMAAAVVPSLRASRVEPTIMLHHD
jgi:predicted permease